MLKNTRKSGNVIRNARIEPSSVFSDQSGLTSSSNSGSSFTTDTLSSKGDIASNLANKTNQTLSDLVKGTHKIETKAVNVGDKMLSHGKRFGKNLVKGSESMAKGTVQKLGNLTIDTVNRTGKVGRNIMKGNIKGSLQAANDLVFDTVDEVVADTKEALDASVHNKYISITLKVLLALYAAFVAPKLSPSVSSIFEHTLFRIVVVVLIIWLATKDAAMAILVALAFVVSVQTANKHRILSERKGQVHYPTKTITHDNSKTEHYTNPDNSHRETENTDSLYANHVGPHSLTGTQRCSKNILSENTDIDSNDTLIRNGVNNHVPEMHEVDQSLVSNAISTPSPTSNVNDSFNKISGVPHSTDDEHHDDNHCNKVPGSDLSTLTTNNDGSQDGHRIQGLNRPIGYKFNTLEYSTY